MSEWISVKDKQPTKENKNGIVCLINGKPILGCVSDALMIFTEYKVNYDWVSRQWVNDEYFGKVTHWMPLPKPPKE